MGLRKEVIDLVFEGNNNIWTNVLVSGSEAPGTSVTASVGTLMLCGTGAQSARTVWIKVFSGSTALTTSLSSNTGAGGSWIRITY